MLIKSSALGHNSNDDDAAVVGGHRSSERRIEKIWSRC